MPVVIMRRPAINNGGRTDGSVTERFPAQENIATDNIDRKIGDDTVEPDAKPTVGCKYTNHLARGSEYALLLIPAR